MQGLDSNAAATEPPNSKIRFERDDGTVLYDDAAVATMSAEVSAQSAAREKCRADDPEGWAAYVESKRCFGEMWGEDPRRKAKVEEFRAARARGEAARLDLSDDLERVERKACAEASWRGGRDLIRRPGITFVPPLRPARARSSHGAAPVRRRGSRRGTRTTSSSSDDPGDPDPPGLRHAPAAGWETEGLGAGRYARLDRHRAAMAAAGQRANRRDALMRLGLWP